ncbi:MAG: M12 family metallopeptidase [Blastocatellales bacterium]
MNTKPSRQLRGNVRRLSALAGLALLLLLVYWAGAVNAQTDQAQGAQNQTRKTNITSGFKIIGGDIQVPKGYSPEAVFQTNLWPNGVVFYRFDDNVTAANRTAMRAAMNVWTPGTGIAFREGIGMRRVIPNLSVPYFIHIQNSTGNNSAVGMIDGGQIMNISDWGNQTTIVHELGHALGFKHEHSRSDRDTFVEIISANVQPGQANQFELLSSNIPKYGPYDFDSIMHYDRCAFSTGCPAGSTCNCTASQETIRVKDPNKSKQNVIGNATALSYLDRIAMSFLYPRGDFRFVDAAYTGSTQNGSFFFPYQSLFIGVLATPTRGNLWVQPGTYRDVGLLNKPMTLRAPLGGVTIRPVQGSFNNTLAAVSAASYNGELAVESIAAAFGENLATGTAAATSQPLPTTLAGVTVKVKDAAGVERDAPLFFVSPGQINYQVPAGTSVGVAGVAVYNGSNIVAAGEIPVVAASPGLFTANASGQGVPAAVLLRVRGEAQTLEPVARFDQTQNGFVPVPIDLGPAGDQVFLILFGSGFRAPNLSSGVTVSIGGEESEVLYAGPAPGFAGLDQANVRVPRSVAGKGDVSVLLTADNRSANAVTINVR